jgi:hypothetical protein
MSFLIEGLTVIYQFEFDIGVNSMHGPQQLRLIHPQDMEPSAQMGLEAPIEFCPVCTQ